MSAQQRDPEMIAKGNNGQLAVYADRVVLARKGVGAFMSQGIGKGDKEIALESISAIQWRNAGALTLGYIQFTFAGALDMRGGILDAQKDENAVTFNKKQQGDFERARALIDAHRAQQRAPFQTGQRASAAETPAPSSAADELAKWAALRDQGIISPDDFEAKKRQLLGL